MNGIKYRFKSPDVDIRCVKTGKYRNWNVRTECLVYHLCLLRRFASRSASLFFVIDTYIESYISLPVPLSSPFVPLCVRVRNTVPHILFRDSRTRTRRIVSRPNCCSKRFCHVTLSNYIPDRTEIRRKRETVFQMTDHDIYQTFSYSIR